MRKLATLTRLQLGWAWGSIRVGRLACQVRKADGWLDDATFFLLPVGNNREVRLSSRFFGMTVVAAESSRVESSESRMSSKSQINCSRRSCIASAVLAGASVRKEKNVGVKMGETIDAALTTLCPHLLRNNQLGKAICSLSLSLFLSLSLAFKPPYPLACLCSALESEKASGLDGQVSPYHALRVSF